MPEACAIMSAAMPPALDARVGRARRTPGQLWQVPTFLAGLLALAAVAAYAGLRQSPESREFETTITALRQGLHAREDADHLVALAEAALVKLPAFEDRAAEVHYLAGSAYFRQAQ